MYRLIAKHDGKTYEVLTRCQCPQDAVGRKAILARWKEVYPTCEFFLTKGSRRTHLDYLAFFGVFHADANRD